MGGKEGQTSGGKRGFAGLSSLVSEIDSQPPPPQKKAEANPVSSSSGNTSSQPELAAKDNRQQAYQEYAQTPAGSSRWKWTLGVAAVIGMAWFIGQSSNNSISPTPTYSTPAVVATPSFTPPPAAPATPTRPQEATPPVGQNLVLSTAQIRYCLAEEIRIAGARSAINNQVATDVDRFNGMVEDYNSRCSSFKYERGALESARLQIEPFRGQYHAAGEMRFAGLPPGEPSAIAGTSQATPQGYGILTYETSFDCAKAKSIPENLVCHDAELARSDKELAKIFELAKISIPDKAAVRQRARKQWNFRESKCADRECVSAWYAYQISTWAKVLQTGDVNAQVE